MPTNKVEPTVLTTAAAEEPKPRRVRTVQKAAAPTPPSEGALALSKEPAKKAPRRKGPATQAEAPTAQQGDTGMHVSFSTEDVSVRAYFIGEHRRLLGLCGDSEGDWLEAERQLRSEALGIAASLRKK